MSADGLKRRELIGAGLSAPLAASCVGTNAPTNRRVAVIGAGIVGASIAYHLAKAGAAVTVLERGEIAGRASRGTFAWLNATWAKQPRDYHRLNQLGLAGWKELEQELKIPIKWGGSIEWFESAKRQARLAEQIAEQAEWGEPARMISGKAMQALEPKAEFGRAPSVAFSANDGALDPVLATQMLLAAAQEMGAGVETDCAVTGAPGEGVLETSKGEMAFDQYVLATGADPEATSALAGIDIPQRTTAGVIVITEPRPPLLERILVAPGVHIHQRLDGRIVLGEQGGPPPGGAHEARLAGRPTRFPGAYYEEQHAQRILDIAEQFLPGLRGAEVEDVLIGWRPLPLDGHPVMGFSPQNPSAYIAISHSGVSLAPILGRLAAQEMLEGVSHKSLAPYRPDREFEQVSRY